MTKNCSGGFMANRLDAQDFVVFLWLYYVYVCSCCRCATQFMCGSTSPNLCAPVPPGTESHAQPVSTPMTYTPLSCPQTPRAKWVAALSCFVTLLIQYFIYPGVQRVFIGTSLTKYIYRDFAEIAQNVSNYVPWVIQLFYRLFYSWKALWQEDFGSTSFKGTCATYFDRMYGTMVVSNWECWGIGLGNCRDAIYC